jgi:sn-glycerol 3-phosphate transport system ATP-binding protein/multiple sugar transport system ATP-binding protein
MGRAIARRPQLFLFDEPLSNLDAALRAEVRVEIKKLHAELRTTMVYVTHDQVEAMTLADRLVVLNAGKIEQQGPPLEVYRRPVSCFVGAFLGSPSMNFIEAEIREDEVEAEGLSLRLPKGAPAGLSGRSVRVGLRPHDILSPGDGVEEGAGTLRMKVDVLEAMGFEAYAHGEVGGVPFVARLEAEAARDLAPGAELTIGVAEGGVHLFDPESERSLLWGEDE